MALQHVITGDGLVTQEKQSLLVYMRMSKRWGPKYGTMGESKDVRLPDTF